MVLKQQGSQVNLQVGTLKRHEKFAQSLFQKLKLRDQIYCKISIKSR